MIEVDGVIYRRESWFDEIDRALRADRVRAFATCAPNGAKLPEPRPRKRKPTLVSVAKQASKAGIEVGRYEVEPDGKINVVAGKSEATEANPWLDDLVTKQ